MPPEISVVVPSYNRRASLARLLDGFERQDVPASCFEMIVVLDGSTDGSAEMLRARATPFRLRVIDQPNAGPGAARNRGVAEAEAPYCLFVDDDMTLEPALVREHLAAQTAAGGAVVMGYIETIAVGGGFPEYEIAFWKLYHHARDRGRPLTHRDCFTGNMSVPVAAFRAAGGFDTHLVRAEDVELALRLIQRGLTAVYAPSARATQHHNKSTAQIIRDHREYGRATIQLAEMYPPHLQGLRLWTLASRDPFAAEIARVAIRLPLPMWLMRAVGKIPPRVPGMRHFYSALRTQQMHRGARAYLHDSDRWDSVTTGVRLLWYRANEISPSELRRQLNALRSAGVDIIRLQDVAGRWQAGTLSKRFTIAIAIEGDARSFDELAPLFLPHAHPWTLFTPEGESPIVDPDQHCDLGIIADAAIDAAHAMQSAGLTLAAFRERNSNDEARAAFEAAGCIAAVSAHGGVIGMRSDLLSLHRLDVPPALSNRAFMRLLRFGRPFSALPF